MFRLLGFILGSIASIGAMVFLLGIPEIQISSFESDQARFDAAIEKIRDKQPDLAEVTDRVGDEIKEAVAIVSDLANEAPGGPLNEMLDEVPDDATRSEPGDDDAEEAVAFFDPIVELPAQADIDIQNYEQQWHEFWNPFRSEMAARGFVTQLEKVTGLDYRIIKVEAGVYQVGFAYMNDNERLAKISQISSATGLEFPEL
jgi:hypothetical protein